MDGVLEKILYELKEINIKLDKISCNYCGNEVKTVDRLPEVITNNEISFLKKLEGMELST